MKKSWFVIVLLVILVSLFGCGRATRTSPQSTFKANFSLNAVVENNKQFLLENTRYSSGAESVFSEPFLQSHEEMVVQIDPNSMPVFMASVRSDIEKALIDNDAQILGNEDELNDIEHFSFSYSENDIQGTIHVWGISGKNTNFTIVVLITEG